LEGLRKTTKTPVMISGVPAQIWSKHLLNMHSECYHYAKLLSVNSLHHWCHTENKSVLIQYLQLEREKGFTFLSLNPFCTSPRTKHTDSNWKLGSIRTAFVTLGTLLTLTEMNNKQNCHQKTYKNAWKCLYIKHKAIPVTGREGPYGCETLRLPHFLHRQ
jgi:hypothetical protein